MQTEKLSFVQSLISNLSSQTTHLHAHIFTTLLLCLAAGEKNIVLRTKTDDVGAVVNHAVSMLVAIFGLPTRRLEIPSTTHAYTPQIFLRSLFLIPPTSSDSGSATPIPRDPARRRNKRPVFTKRLSIPRSEPSSSSSAHGIPPPSQPERKPSSRLNPNGAISHRRYSHERLSHTRMSGSFGAFDDASSTRAMRPQSSHGFPLTPHTPETFLSELPAPSSPPPVQHTYSASSYSSALTSQLSRSSESTPPTISGPRLPHVLVLTKLERASPQVQISLTETLRTRRIVLEHDEDDEDEDDEDDGGTWNLPSGFFIVYVCKIDKDRPGISKSLLDRFAFSSLVNIDENSSMQHSGYMRRAALVSHDEVEALQHLSTKSYIRPHLDTYILSLLSTVRNHPDLDGSLLTARSLHDFMDFVRAACVIFSTSISPPLSLHSDSEGGMSATEKDVLRVFAGLVGHRVNVREEWDGVLGSMAGGAVGRSQWEDGLRERKANGGGLTVQSVLLEVMKAV